MSLADMRPAIMRANVWARLNALARENISPEDFVSRLEAEIEDFKEMRKHKSKDLLND